MKKMVYHVICLFTLLACANRDRLSEVLEMSKSNQDELLQVLQHYSRPQDSLKLKAACFLIENMPGHFSYDFPMCEEEIGKLDSLSNVPRFVKKMIETTLLRCNSQKVSHPDIETVTAAFLIHQIDLAFRQWQENPWNHSMDFQTFCDYLLPYRVDHETLDYWRDSIGHVKAKLEELLRIYNPLNFSPSELQKYFSFASSGMRGMGPLSYRYLECREEAIADMFLARTIGIPLIIDYVPHYANHNGRHYWVSLWDVQRFPQYPEHIRLHTVGKVFRQTYAHNPLPCASHGEYIPSLFRTPFNRDVTHEYLRTSDVAIRVPCDLPVEYAYLAVFNERKWQPVWYGKIHHNRVNFHNMGREVVYLPVWYNKKGRMFPLGYPFLLKSDGHIHTFCPDTARLSTLNLKRKYTFRSKYNATQKEDLQNIRIVTADDADFKINKQTVLEIKAYCHSDFMRISLDSLVPKQYWRIECIYPRRRTDVAEIKLITASKQEIKPCNHSLYPALFDNDPLSCVTITQPVDLDCGEKISLSELWIMPRNDGNGIYTGNMYELLYMDNIGWVSCGCKIATSNQIDFDNVPSGALYWLRNRTSGQEERIFIYTNEQIFY